MERIEGIQLVDWYAAQAWKKRILCF